MKTILKETITGRVVFLGVIGCLIFFGSLVLFVIKGCRSDTVSIVSDALHPYTSEAVLNSRVPIELPPFSEPSLEGLVAALQAELGLTDAEVAADAERIAQERELGILNYRDSRRDPAARQAAWEQRKRLVVAIPELLWKPGFVLPPALNVMELRDTSLYDYRLKDGIKLSIKLSEPQIERIKKLHNRWQDDEITDIEYWRGWAAIVAEQTDSLTVAKILYYRGSVGSAQAQLGIEYAERVIQENPDSFEAHHVWALCNREYYYETDNEKAIEGYRNLVDRFPNSSIALQELSLLTRFTYPEEALGYIQRAIQLDDRIERNNGILARCYHYLGEYEKALAVYQGMSEVWYGHLGGQLTYIYIAQGKVYKQRRQQQGE